MSSFKSKLLNGFVWRLCFYLSSFVLNIFIANSFGAEKSGVFYLLLNNLAIIVLFMTFGLESAVAYFNARKEVATSQLLSLSVLWSLCTSVLLLLIYLAAVQLDFINFNRLAPYLILYVFSSILANCLSSILFSRHNNIVANLTLSIINIILILILPDFPVGKLIFSDTDYTKQYLLISSLPTLIYLCFLFVKKIRFSYSMPGMQWLKKMLHFSTQAFLYSAFYVLLLRCDYWMVNHFCSNNDLGNYLQATKLSQLILVVPTLVSFSLFPLIVSHIHQHLDVESKLIKLTSVYFFTGLLICIVILLTGHWVLPWLYGKSFSKMYLSFLLIAPGTLALAAAYPLTTYFTGNNLLKIIITASVVAIAVLLCLDLLLIPSFGIYGAAVASTIAYSFYFFYQLYQFRKKHNFSLVQLLNINAIVKDNIPARFKKSSHVEN